MLVSFTGAQSVGKTTLLNMMKNDHIFIQNPLFSEVIFIEEITRKIQKRGFGINLDANDDTQRQILQAHMDVILKREKDLQHSKPHPLYILDRCLLDGFVYTKYFNEIGKVTDDFFNYYKERFERYRLAYDEIFYIRPEFDIVHDGVRSTDKEFQRRVSEIFDETISQFNMRVTVLTGSIEERYAKIVETSQKWRT